jgi:hypothetical protein
MALNPPNLNPLLSFPDNSQLAEMSVDGIVIDRVYGATGVLDTLQNTTTTQYQDPNSNQINPSVQNSLPNQGNATVWYSSLVDDVYNTGFALSFQFSRATFINYVTFDLLNVPCSWTLLQVSGTYSPLIGGYVLAQGVVNGTNNQGWINFEETFPGTGLPTTSNFEPVVISGNQISQALYGGEQLYPAYPLTASGIMTPQSPYYFDSTISLVLVINKLPTGTQYNFGVQNFLTKLVVQTIEDLEVNDTLITNFTTQNSFGFVETFTPVVYEYENFQIPNQESVYWKSTPQPVKDAVVWFILDFGQTQAVNRMYVDPLYTGCSFNLYWSVDSINWTPINQDLTLHKGIYRLNPICARYFKLEFSQLVPEVYDLPFDSINRVIQVFPDYVDTYFLQLEQALLDAPAQTYNNLVGNSPNILYNNSPSISSNYGALVGQLSANQYGGSPSNLGLANLGDNSSSYSVVDPTVSYKNLLDVAGEGSIFSNVGDTPFMNRRFYQYGPHTYKEVSINQTWHEAYFVGIKYLSFYCMDQVGFPQ